MMGCPQRLDDIMNTYTYSQYDIYMHMHGIVNINDSQSYSNLHVESFTPCFYHVYYLLNFIPYILGTLFGLTSLLPRDAAFYVRKSRQTGYEPSK